MDFNKARTFIEVADCASVTEAANRLLRTQQAISLQLQQLEQDIGVALFDRHGPKITLTVDGEQLYKVFKPNLLAMENAVMGLKADKQHVGGKIRIGVWPEQASGYLPQMIRIFAEQHPLVDFDISITNDNQIERLLLANQIDFGLMVFCHDKKLLRQIPVYRQPLLPVVSRRFLQAHGPIKQIAQTLDLALLDYPEAYSAYNQWMAKNARKLLPSARKKNRAITASNNVALKDLVLQDLGLAFLHQDAIQAELGNGELKQVLTTSRHIHVSLDLVYKRKSTLSFVHQNFVDRLKEEAPRWSLRRETGRFGKQKI